MGVTESRLAKHRRKLGTDPFTEKDLARYVVEWLQGYDVYQEVQAGGYGGRVADLVVDVGGRGWVIECKLTFGLSVLEQAEQWIRSGVTRVSVAVPRGRGSSRLFAYRIADWLGVGVLSVCQNGGIQVEREPRFNRPDTRRRSRRGDILQACCEEHKTHCEAGGNQGGYWTPYSQTCRAVLGIVKDHPGLSYKELMDQLKGKHHYKTDSSARASLSTWIRIGKVPGVRSERDGKFTRIYLRQEEGES